MPLGFNRILDHGDIIDEYLTAARSQVAGYHIHRGRFAHTVRAKESVYLSLLCLERYVLYYLAASVGLTQILYFQQNSLPLIRLLP